MLIQKIRLEFSRGEIEQFRQEWQDATTVGQLSKQFRQEWQDATTVGQLSKQFRQEWQDATTVGQLSKQFKLLKSYLKIPKVALYDVTELDVIFQISLATIELHYSNFALMEV